MKSTEKQVVEIERDAHGRWLKGISANPYGRPASSESIRKLLESRKEDLINKAVEMALDGDATALKICIDRLVPPPKAESPLVMIPALVHAKGLTEKAEALITAVAEGQMSPDVCCRLLSALASYAKAIEVDQLTARIDLLEEMIAVNKNDEL